MAKQYALEFHDLMEYEGNMMGWYSRGHFDHEEFLAALKAEEPYLDTEFLGDTVQVYWRCVPTGQKGEVTFQDARPGARGAFPATVLYGRR